MVSSSATCSVIGCKNKQGMVFNVGPLASGEEMGYFLCGKHKDALNLLRLTDGTFYEIGVSQESRFRG